MTEEEWLTGFELEPTLKLVCATENPRKLRLLMAACVRQAGSKGMHPNVLHAADVIERYADDIVSAEGLAVEAREAWEIASSWEVGPETPYPDGFDEFLAEQDIYRAAAWALEADTAVGGLPEIVKESVWLLFRFSDPVERIRDIFGNPFRPVAFDPRWRTSDVVGLARSIYEDRAFDRLPVLADALMDAGCADDQVLGHCRGAGPHVRGCWVVDLVLGKE
jgi:hypothetical protein